MRLQARRAEVRGGRPSMGFHAFPRFGFALAIAALDLDSPLQIWK
jgi:hypothetical protein